MTKEQQPIILMSSDGRFKYIEDIFCAVALPAGTAIQFRYENKYIPGDILGDLLKLGRMGRRSLLVFKGIIGDGIVIVPVRWAKITAVKKIGDFVVIRLVVEGYPIFNSQCRDGKIETIKSCSDAYFAQMPSGLKEFPVCASQIGFVNHDQGYDTEHWLSIVKYLSAHKSFDGLHFLRIGVFKSAGNESNVDSAGVVDLSEESYVEVPIEFYADRFDSEEELSIAGDEDIIRLASGGIHHLRSRYDSISSLLHVRRVEGITRTVIRLNLKSHDPEREFIITVPISVHRKPFIYWRGMIIPFFGAILIAVQDFLRSDVDINIKIFLIIIGALLIAAGNLRR